MDNLQIYLNPTFFIDSDSPQVIQFAKSTCKGETSNKGRALKLFYKVRDEFLYDPFKVDSRPEVFRASYVLTQKATFCIPKAVLLAAASRAVNIPSRLGFADVRNHLTTKRLHELMKTDLFIFHGYTELFLDGKWVKATPAFNLSLCERFGVHPLEFDGEHDAIFHEFNREGNRHMEYVRDRGQFADLPYDDIVTTLKKYYPFLFSQLSTGVAGDFEKETISEIKK